MGRELRKNTRVQFERGVHAYIMGIDGTWRRDCEMLDISESGVLLRIVGSLAGLDLKEFFLLLSSTGLAYRRCELVRLSGDQVGARFHKIVAKKKAASPAFRREPVDSGL